MSVSKSVLPRKKQQYTRVIALELINGLRVSLTRSCLHKEGAGPGRYCSILEDHGVYCAQLHDERTAPSLHKITGTDTRNQTACQLLNELSISLSLSEI
jgi:hypothetical protein